MIRRVLKEEKDKLSSYLKKELPASSRIIADIRSFGFESDDFYIYADFWADGEIKYIFTVLSGKISIYSYANEIDIIDIYVFLRDNFIGYRSVQGIEDKIRDFRRHTLFREIKSYDIMTCSVKHYKEPEGELPACREAKPEDLEFIYSLFDSDSGYSFIPSKRMIEEMIEAGEVFAVKENGAIKACALTLNRAMRHAEVAILSAESASNEDKLSAIKALCEKLYLKKYRCSVRTDKLEEKSLFKSLGFSKWDKDLYIAR